MSGVESLFLALPKLREKTERPIVYPLNRDECLSLIERVERLEQALVDVHESLIVESDKGRAGHETLRAMAAFAKQKLTV